MKVKLLKKVPYLLGASLLILALVASACGDEDTPTAGVATQPAEGTPGVTEEATPGVTPSPGVSPSPGMTEEPTTAAAIEVTEHLELGPMLIDGEGITLYLFEQDQQGESTCYDGCAEQWPPLLTDGEPVAGEGVDASLLGTIERDDGQTQVTYNDWPLYYYTPDAAPGDVNGHQVGDVWFAISPEGEPIG